MQVAAKGKLQEEQSLGEGHDLSRYVPKDLLKIENPQTAIPRIAKDLESVRLIEAAVQQVPTVHWLYLGDARNMSSLRPESVQLVLTSPPYWTLKEYRRSDGQLGHVADYEQFLLELDKTW